MRTFCRPILCHLALLCCLCWLNCSNATGQTLARPGWAGSGLEADAWWRTAIFYRVDVAHFQDSDGDGVGDFRGVAQRLDYLQSLGVDAVVLEPPGNGVQFDEAQFDDLLRAASAQRVRLLVALPVAESRVLLANARRWLTRGAAGLVLPSALLKSNGVPARELHNMVTAMAGQRVLLALPEAGRAGRAELARSESADLIGLSTDIPQSETDAPFPAALRRALMEVQVPVATSSPLLYTDNCCRTADAELFPGDAARTLGMNEITAARLLASRGAAVLLYGQELALLSPAHAAVTMRWTPSNVTPKQLETAAPSPASAPAPATRGREDVYGAFVPYVAPKPVKKAAPDAVGVAKVDFDSLPGFSPVASSPAEVTAANAAAEDADPRSLLNFYRRLVQLHHGNPSLRSGTPYVLDHDREQALVWVRRAPAGARTAATVIVACNLSAKPLHLSLRGDLERLRIRPGTLRPLLASWTQTPGVQLTDDMQLPPYSVFVGELFHGGR